MSEQDLPLSEVEEVMEGQAATNPGLPRRVLDTFLSPGRLTESLAENPAWAGALLLGALLVVLQALLIPVEIWETMFREAALQRGQDVPEGFAMGGGFMRLSAVIGGAIGWFVMTFAVAGIVALIFAFVLGDEGRYRQYLAVLAHAWLISAFTAVALVPLKIATETPQLTLNLGSFFFFLPDGYFLKVLTALDLSQLWGWLVVAQGAHAIDGRRSFKSAAIILLGLAVLMAMAVAPFLPES